MNAMRIVDLRDESSEGSTEYLTEIICLANSYKHRGRCVAGIEVGSGKWIRPVSGRSTREVSAAERQYHDGEEPRVLDVVSVSLLRSQPSGIHRENWVLDSRRTWERVGRIGWGELCALEQRPRHLFEVNGHSNCNTNDRIPARWRDVVEYSLLLVWVDELIIEVRYYGDHQEKIDVRARFKYEGWWYKLRVTDPMYIDRFRIEGRYQLRESFLVVSLTEEFKSAREGDANFHKVVAAIVERVKVEPGRRR